MKLRTAVNALRLSLRTIANPLRLSLGDITSPLRLGLVVLSKRLAVAVGLFLWFIKPSDNLTASDSRSYIFRRRLVETVSVLEVRLLQYSKVANDRASFSDGEPYFAEDYVVGAPLAQTYTEPLQVVKVIRKPLVESPALVDTDAKVFSKVISHSVFSTDDLNGVVPGDDQTLAVFKSLNNGIQAAETFVFKMIYRPSFTETPNLTSTGYLRSQGYTVDMSYFEEDYVGASRTF